MTQKYIGAALQDRALEALKSQDTHQLKVIVVEAVPTVIRLESEVRLLEHVITGDHGGKGEHVRALRMRIGELSARVAHYEQVGQARSRPGLVESFRNLQVKYRAKKDELRKAQQHIDKLNKEMRELKEEIAKTSEHATRIADSRRALEGEVTVLRRNHTEIEDKLAQFADMIRARKAREAAELREKLQAILPTLPMLDRGTPNECDAAVEEWSVYEQVAEIIGATLPQPCTGRLKDCALAKGHKGTCTTQRPQEGESDEMVPVTCGAPLGRGNYCVRDYRHDQQDFSGHSHKREDTGR